MGALGVAYAGDGSVSLSSNPNPPAVQAALESERAKIRSFARDLQFWPVIKIGLSYSF